jgi:hypothetical protein
VVPVGDAAAWSKDAFAAEVVDGVLIGRGSVDMKSAIAAFAAAAAEAIADGKGCVAPSRSDPGTRRGGHPRTRKGGRGGWPPRAR